ncbi:thiosulfate/3-mercaptopyruvate sulfurtransferase [Geosmithia morbida]|uniref:Thiosulfate/3-mercaptopyruvate sulfurtransferase n=1 Tax=Geosmithia morbida TaxID=1094350 RepID=A0A9P4YZ65_9HYPO|nr:thiosulfate/3-mercaptopyruvate sulfurtransferase [Geosmithia morbida]KAF4125217.1 thiosulfate/3-mercaptopyruvate sulfurtransferase [Geosmithia morbida]
MAIALLVRPAWVAPAAAFGQVRTYTTRGLSSYLVTPTELNEAIKRNAPSPISTDPRTIPLCASWFMPNAGLKGIDVYRQQRVPKARFFDLDKVCDKRSPYPHMLPDAKGFAAAMSELGIRRDDEVVVYDSQELGIFSAPRVAWTLKAFGHPRVHILNNFKLWIEQGLPTESGELYTVECSTYPIPEMDEYYDPVATFEEVREVARDHNKEGAEGVQILDARPAGRFDGSAPEPREGLSSGHMPGSINIPFPDLLDPETKTYKSPEELTRYFESKGVDPAKPIISSCGTGVTACIINEALEIAGYGSAETRKVYDGSWTEWAQRVRPSDNLIVKKSQ